MLLVAALLALSPAVFAILNTGVQLRIEEFFDTPGHTNNWAVLVCTSRFWFNYRHVSNVLALYRTVKRLGIPESNIILMLAEDVPCNPRNPRPGTVYAARAGNNLYGIDVEVDYRGEEVTVENFIRLLTGRHHPATPRSKRLLTDHQSNVLIYLTGHGGDSFLKFQDAEELTNVDLAYAIQTMYEDNRYHEVFLIADTCRSASMYEWVSSPGVLSTSSSLTHEESYSYDVHDEIGVYVIDRMFSTISESAVVFWLSVLMIASGVFTMLALLLGQKATYGRYTAHSSVMIPARVAWVVQEMPSFVIPLCYIIQCRSLAGVVLLTVFLLHYFNRTFIYPFQIKSGNGTPWYICLSAIVFCIWNGYIQGSYHSKFYDPPSFFSNALTYIGVIVFAAGMFINIQSDAILRNLRNPGETGYKIPRGGMFEYVSGANFFGEIVEWSGYAIMSGGSLPAVAFACFTACNIGPRALHHHQWYHSKFPDYPKERKAVIPFIL